MDFTPESSPWLLLGEGWGKAAMFVASGWMVPDCLYASLILPQSSSFPMPAPHQAFGVQGETEQQQVS